MSDAADAPSRTLSSVVILALVLGLISAGSAHAQERPFPYTLDHRDRVILPAGLALAIVGRALESGTDPITREEIAALAPRDVNWIDRPATENWSPAWDDRSDAYRTAAAGVATLVLGVEGVRALTKDRVSDGATLAVISLEVLTLVAGVTHATKALTGRKRPYVFNTAMSVDERYEIAAEDGGDAFFSFYSGHTSTAFAAATLASTLFTDIYGTSTWSYLVWGSTLTVAAATGYSRVKAGQHYPTDVIVGAIVGGAIGHLVPRLHRKVEESRLSISADPGSLSLRLRF